MPTWRSSPSTTSPTPDTLAALLARDSVLRALPGPVQREESRDRHRRRTRCGCSPSASPPQLPWSELGRRRRDRVDGTVPHPGPGGRRTSTAGASKVIVSAPMKGSEPADANVVLGVNFEQAYDPERHRSDHQRLLHDQLPGARGQGPARGRRDTPRPDDDDPRLHRRPEPARRAPQRPAQGARGSDQPGAHLDGRREGARPRDPRARGTPERPRRARARAHRLDRRPHDRERDGPPPRRRSTRRSASAPRAADVRASSSTARTRSSPRDIVGCPASAVVRRLR